MTEESEATLRRVRGLLAKAASTEFEGERQAFLDKADQLMEAYAITEAMLRLADDPNAKLIKRRAMDFSWFFDIRELDRDAQGSIYWLWDSCVRHCRCVTTGWSKYQYLGQLGDKSTIPVYGTESDLTYLDLLFTDLFLQLAGSLRPVHDPKKDMGHNIAIAKAAGVKYASIAIWLGKPEWVVDGKPVDHGIMARAYKAYANAHSEPWITMSPRAWQWSFVDGFCSAVRSRLFNMAQQRQGRSDGDSTGSTALVVRSITDQAREEMYGDFPDLRPHPDGCSCAGCKKRKSVATRQRRYSALAGSSGREAGQNARIASGDGKLSGRKGLNS